MHWIFAHLIGDYLLQNDWMAKGKNWARLTEDMAMQYGCSSSKGQALVTISQLCKQADAGICEYSNVGGKIGIYGSIPSCIENGSDFS